MADHFVASPILLALLLLIALAIRLEGPGPIFYTQKRIGLNGQAFDIIKFRSMILNADELREQLVKESGEDPRHPKIKNDPRITSVGRFIRVDQSGRTAEYHQCLARANEPRWAAPPTPDEVKLYEPWHMQRLQILPGLTGFWQVNGRSEVPFDEMCLLDIYYIENWSVQTRCTNSDDDLAACAAPSRGVLSFKENFARIPINRTDN